MPGVSLDSDLCFTNWNVWIHKDLTHSHTMTHFEAPGKQAF